MPALHSVRLSPGGLIVCVRECFPRDLDQPVKRRISFESAIKNRLRDLFPQSVIATMGHRAASLL
jgi:hypothetical protein